MNISSPIAVVTGAGSGVGRAVALQLAREDWRVALIGRRRAALEETRLLAGPLAHRLLACPCDIRSAENVSAMAQTVREKLGEPLALINAAGTNVPRRALAVLSQADFAEMMETNLHGAYHCVQAFLPGMRERQLGTIVNVISDAGKQASPKAGPAYVMSKFGLTGLTQSINAEERGHGVRACAVFPGDIDTPLLDRRPVPPDAEARSRMMKPEDVAACVVFCLRMPSHVIVEELLVRPR